MGLTIIVNQVNYRVLVLRHEKLVEDHPLGNTRVNNISSFINFFQFDLSILLFNPNVHKQQNKYEETDGNKN